MRTDPNRPPGWPTRPAAMPIPAGGCALPGPTRLRRGRAGRRTGRGRGGPVPARPALQALGPAEAGGLGAHLGSPAARGRRGGGRRHPGAAQVRHGGLPEERLLASPGQARRAQGALDQLPPLQTDSDPTLVVGWAGWDHLQQATALVAYYDARKREGWDAKRLTPLLAGPRPTPALDSPVAPRDRPGVRRHGGPVVPDPAGERRPRTRPDPGRHPQLAAAPGDDPATGEDVTMDKLISELLILPERVRKGDFVLNLSKGVTEPEKTLDQYVVTPATPGVASTTPWASSGRPSMPRTARRATCTAASVPASRTSWPCCT